MFDDATFPALDKYLPESVVVYTCREGYSFLPRGDNSITCGNDGKWQWNLGTCYSSTFAVNVLILMLLKSNLAKV